MTALVKSELEDREDLDAAALRLYRFGFDRVALRDPTLGYEPRSSCQCRDCAAFWIGSKAGPVMRIDLRADPGGGASGPRQRSLSGNSGARTLRHVHDEHDSAALTIPTSTGESSPASFLLIGRDDGVLDIIPDDEGFLSARPEQRRHAVGTGLHLDSWAGRGRGQGSTIKSYVPRSGGDWRPTGITAISTIADPEHKGALLILAATRRPRLHVIHAQHGRLELRGTIAMPGWIDWIVLPEGQRAEILCVSRGGYVTQLSMSELSLGDPSEPYEPHSLPLYLHPTAVLPFGKRGLLIGTKRGLAFVADPTLALDREHAPVVVPVTRSPVLCLDREDMPGLGRKDMPGLDHEGMPGLDCHMQRYVTMGLEDGRIRVAEAEMIEARAGAVNWTAPDRRSFSVEMGEAVLALETMQVDEEPGAPPADSAFLLVMLRDHSVRLFKVAGPLAQHNGTRGAWSRHLRKQAAGSGLAEPEWDFATVAAAARRLVREPGDREVCHARRFLLIQEVLSRSDAEPGWRAGAGDPAEIEQSLLELAVAIAASEDDRVQRALALAMDAVCKSKVDRVLELSLAMLSGLTRYRQSAADDAGGGRLPVGAPELPRRLLGRRPWEQIVSDHLGQLHRLASTVRGDDRTRLVAWARFVRKYVVRGHTFAAKQLSLGSLVEQNNASGKYFDALIYQARLVQRGYDLRWEQVLGTKISALHPVHFGVTQIAVVVTLDARVKFIAFDGSLLPVRYADAPASLAMKRFRDRMESSRSHHRLLTCAVQSLGAGARIILAMDGEGLPPAGIEIVEVNWPSWPIDKVRVTAVEDLQGDAEIISHTRIHSLCKLPGSDVYIAGLESSESPFGRIFCVEGASKKWALECWRPENSPREEGSPRGANELSSVAPGKMPTRALAAARRGEHDPYLVVAGSDDGQVYAFSCRAIDPVSDWRIERWDQITDAVTSVALGPHVVGDVREPAFSCYLSTSAGEILALSIVAELAEGHRPASGYVAYPLWRDTQEGAVVAMHMWKNPQYQEDVLAVTMQRGRMILYNHGCFDKRVSMEKNYWFRGMQLGRVALPGPLTTVGLFEGKSEVVAADSTGRLYGASLVNLRNGTDREKPGPLPSQMWTSLRHLLDRSNVAWPFSATSADPLKLELKLKLCELVPIDAVSEYAFSQRREPLEISHGLTGAELLADARQQLASLDPDRPADAVRIKILLKSVGRTFLLRDPGEVLEAIRQKNWPRHEATGQACDLLARYVTDKLAHSTPATARLRIAAIKELLRVGLLHHMAKPEDPVSDQIRQSVERALVSCLRDDERIVRIETLRALAVMLRNARVMLDKLREEPSEKVREVTASLFPQGLGSLTWALDCVVERIGQFPARKRGSALVASSWYRIAVLSHVFRLFPSRTLALCDYVARVGWNGDVVRLCYELLRRPSATATRDDAWRPTKLIELYLLSYPRSSRTGSAEELAQYVTPELRRQLRLSERSGRGESQAAERAWYEVDDVEYAQRLLDLVLALAHMWRAKTASEIVEVPDSVGRQLSTSAIAAVPRPLAALERAVDELVKAANMLSSRAYNRLDGLKPSPELQASCDAMPESFAHAIFGILETWRGLYREAPKAGDKLGKYTLGDERDREGTSQEFQLRGQDSVLTVMWPSDEDGAQRFLDAARLNRELARAGDDRDRFVRIEEVLETARPAYVMRESQWLDNRLVGPGERRPLALRASVWLAENVGKALRALHECNEWHGAVNCSTVAVTVGEEWSFRLGRFDRGRIPRSSGGAGNEWHGPIPECFAQRVPSGATDLQRRQWADVVSLLLLLYWVMTGERVKSECLDLQAYRERVEALAKEVAELPRTLALVDLLRRLFASNGQMFTAAALVAGLDPKVERMQPGRRRPSRPMTILYVSSAEDLNLSEEFGEIGRQVMASEAKHYWNVASGGCNPAQLITVLDEHRNGGRDLFVHFGCHGSPGILHLEGDTGPEFIEAFKSHRERVRGVVLASCYADELAKQLVQFVEVVVHATGQIRDNDAIAFTSFYHSLGSGADVEAACLRGNITMRQFRRRMSDGVPRDMGNGDSAGQPGNGAEVRFKVAHHENLAPQDIKFFTPATSTLKR